MGESLFTGMLALFWLAEATFGAVVVYWFLRQGFGGEGTLSASQFALEDPSLTKQNLAIWGGFFLAIVVGIIVGA